VGLLLPFGVHGLEAPSQRTSLAVLALVGVALTFVFTALAFVAASRSDDRLRRMGTAVGLWLLVAVVYDGLVLVLVMLFGDYPIERPMLGLMFANPVDLARVILLLQFDLSALLGYTGAVFQQLFSGGRGVLIAAAALGFWVIAPVVMGLRAFERRDV
jgi:Cu-processing system permease protein